jgi:hypothetical protein
MIDVHEKATGRMKYQRRHRVQKRCNPCECKFAFEHFPALSPELNLAENTQNQLRKVVQDLCSEDDCPTWIHSNTYGKMDILRKAISRLDADKQYRQKLIKSLKKDYKWVAENDGALLKRFKKNCF